MCEARRVQGANRHRRSRHLAGGEAWLGLERSLARRRPADRQEGRLSARAWPDDQARRHESDWLIGHLCLHDGAVTSQPPGSGRRRMTGKERREQLLDIGRRLFAERGLDGTSIEEIAAQADVSKPVVYEHFGGKEGLYAVVVDREVERFVAMATSLLGGENSMEKFEVAAVGLLRYIQENSDGFRILVRDSNPSSGSGTFASLISDIASQVEYILGDLFEERGYDAKLTSMYAQMLVGMVAFAGQWWLDARKPELEEVAAHLVNLAWRGLSDLDPKPRISPEAVRRLREQP